MWTRSRLIALSVVLALASPPAVSFAADVALGDRGELYVAQTGSYGDLFPEGEHGLPADRPVLAVDLLVEGEPSQRLLVPTTGGPELERAPTLGFESASQTLYAIWEGQREPTVSALYLSGLGRDGWSDPVEISGNVAPLKGAPQVEIISQTYRLPGPDGEGMIEHSRTLFHVLWWEQSDAGSHAYYAAVLLDDGEYPGWNPVIRLNDYAGPAAEAGREATEALLRAPTVRSGRNISSSVIAFADAEARRFITMEARLLPAELGRIADDLRGQIIEIGHSGDPGKPASIHDRLRGQIIEIGRNLNPGVLDHFASKVIDAYDRLAEKRPAPPVEALADDLRGQIIEIGARLLTGVEPRVARGAGPILEIDRAKDAGNPAEGSDGVSHLVQLRTLQRAPIPPTGGRAVNVFVSEDGHRALVRWTGGEDEEVFYTELVQDGERAWTVPKKLVFGSGIDRSQLDSVLSQRVSRRP